ncbi:MAG: transcriptional repressor [Pseudomonadota bacterium]
MQTSATGALQRARKSRDGFTQNDRTVLSCLQTSQAPMKAYELLEALRSKGINAPMTVYRALSRLSAGGHVRKIESLNAYYAMPEGDRGSYGAFFLCDGCDAIAFKQLSAEELNKLVPGVDVTDAAIELRTKCVAPLGPLLSGRCGCSSSDDL